MSDDFIPSIKTTQAQAKPPASVQPSAQNSSRSSSDEGFIPSIRTSKADTDNNEQPGMLDRADAAINDALAPNPQNYESLARTNLIEVPKTAAREVYSAGKTIGSIPGSIYKAFTDEATPEELAEKSQFEKE